MSDISPLPTSAQPLTDKSANPVWYRYFASLDRAARAAVTTLAGAVATSRQIIAGAGLTGGGDFSADRTLNVGAGTGISVTADAVALDTANGRNVDHSAVSISAGTGLTGGGDISASRSLALANTAVTAATYGGSGKRTTLTVNAQGQLTAASDASITAAEITSAAALTKTDDTNVTLTLGGTPATALLKASSITLGWTGTLAAARLNANVVQAITNDTNLTGSITTQTLTLGWTGTLAVPRGGTGAGTASGTALDNITGFASTGILVRTTAGTYAFRTLTGPAAGITVTNGNGVSGNQTLALANDLAALEALSSTGYAKRTGTDAWSLVTPAFSDLSDYVAPTAWTPVLTCITPGDLAVSYSFQIGWYVRHGKQVTAYFSLLISSATWTTASGELRITGLPFTSKTSAGFLVSGAMFYQGINKSGYTTVLPALNNSNIIKIEASGMGVGFTTVNIADMTSGGAVDLIGTITFPID